MVNSVTNSTTTGASQPVTTSINSEMGATQDRFLKLLVTQMKNQDPLNPMDNAQVTSQMAQLSTVSGIDKLNSTVQALSASMMSAQSLQAVSMIGHVALINGDSMELKDGQAFGAVDLKQPVDSLNVTIRDKYDNPVRVMKMGGQDTGVVEMKWDGLTDSGVAAADGQYTFSAVAEQGGKKVEVTPLSYGLVNSVAQSAGGVTVNVGNAGEVSLNSIRKIL